MSHIITQSIIDQAYTYEQFKKVVRHLYDQGEPTSGSDSEMPLLEFTKLNLQRMNRIEKTVQMNEDLKAQLDSLPNHVYWVVLVEGWCGDVGQNLPIIDKLSAASNNVTLKILFRDENLEIMDHYLTYGGRSIPKLICLDGGTWEELGTWGPRPEPVQNAIMEMKENKPEVKSRKDWVEEIHEFMHKWYAEDQGHTIQQEFKQMAKSWKDQQAVS